MSGASVTTGRRAEPTAAELATVLDLLRGMSAELVNVGHGRGARSIACVAGFADAWLAAGGEIGTVVSWPAIAASWQRPACRLAAGAPDAWVLADESAAWETFLPRLSATGTWRPRRSVAFAHLVYPQPPRPSDIAAVDGVRGAWPDGSCWIMTDGIIRPLLAP
jgi:hypothetical protein